MMFKTRSLATKLLLLSCLSAVVVIVFIVAIIKLSMIPKMTDTSLISQTQTMAYALKGVLHDPQVWTEENLAKQNAVLDDFSNRGNGVATLFIFKNGEYVRAATTLLNSNGSRAVGTALDASTPAAQALNAGKSYSGPITLFNRPHMTTYLPVNFPNGTRGAVFIGIDYSSADAMLLMAKQMDYVTYAVGVISILLLGIGLFYSIRVEEAHRETEDIMRTTQDGLFLLDHELRMGSQTSMALSKILGFEVYPGANFLNLLKSSVSPKTYDTAKEYIDLLLRHDVKEKLVASLNPLDCIEISSLQANGRMESRFLQIKFNRVAKAGKITHLLVTANDITRQVKLERELRESERRVQDQMALMVHILQADPEPLQNFLSGATNGLNDINEILRLANPKTGVTTAELDTIMRRAHQLKGDASALQLEAVTKSLHELETLMQGMKNQPEHKNEDLLPVAVKIKTLFAEISAIQEVMTRISQVGDLVSIEPPRPPRDNDDDALHPLPRQWKAFTQQLSNRLSKKVELSYRGMDLAVLATPLRDAINTIVNQFIRNSLVHGVEEPKERLHSGKTETAHLSVYVADLGDGMIELSFRDDGRGINPEKIRQAIVRAGLFTDEAAKALSMRQLILQIFEPGLSTHETVDEDAGRGVGLDAVKELISSLGGRIRLGSTPGEYCHFKVQLPFKTELKQVLPEPNPKPSEESI